MHSWVQVDHIRWRALAMQVSCEPLWQYREKDWVRQRKHYKGTKNISLYLKYSPPTFNSVEMLTLLLISEPPLLLITYLLVLWGSFPIIPLNSSSLKAGILSTSFSLYSQCLCQGKKCPNPQRIFISLLEPNWQLSGSMISNPPENEVTVFYGFGIKKVA